MLFIMWRKLHDDFNYVWRLSMLFVSIVNWFKLDSFYLHLFLTFDFNVTFSLILYIHISTLNKY